MQMFQNSSTDGFSTNMITPMSVNGVYIFKFDDEGAISRIETFYRGAPLGWDAIPDGEDPVR